MPETSTFNCPKCGASLTPTGNASEMQCPYCGNTVIVPQELRTTSFEMPQITLVDEQAAGTVGKAVAATVGISLALPILIGVITLCIIGATFYFVSQTISQSFSGITQFANPTSIAAFVTSIPAPTAAPQFTDTPRPTRTATSTPLPTPLPAATPTPYTKVILKDDFSNPSSGWDRKNSGDLIVDYVKGGYRIFIGREGVGELVWVKDGYSNISVEADVKKIAGPDDAWFGVTCRMKDGGGYAFKVSMDGSYEIDKEIFASSGDQTATLTSGTLDSNLLKVADSNHIRATCDHDTLSLFVNEQFISQTSDTSFTTGGVGLVSSPGDSGQSGLDHLYSNFLVKGP